MRLECESHSKRKETPVSTGFKMASSETFRRQCVSVFEFVKIPGDGNCLFSSIGYALNKSAEVVRQAVLRVMRMDVDFKQRFVDMCGEEEYAELINATSTSGIWGGDESICAACVAFRVQIMIHQPKGVQIVVDPPSDCEITQRINLWYNGINHYDALTSLSDREISVLATDPFWAAPRQLHNLYFFQNTTSAFSTDQVLFLERAINMSLGDNVFDLRSKLQEVRHGYDELQVALGMCIVDMSLGPVGKHVASLMNHLCMTKRFVFLWRAGTSFDYGILLPGHHPKRLQRLKQVLQVPEPAEPVAQVTEVDAVNEPAVSPPPQSLEFVERAFYPVLIEAQLLDCPTIRALVLQALDEFAPGTDDDELSLRLDRICSEFAAYYNGEVCKLESGEVTSDAFASFVVNACSELATQVDDLPTLAAEVTHLSNASLFVAESMAECVKQTVAAEYQSRKHALANSADVRSQRPFRASLLSAVVKQLEATFTSSDIPD